MFGGKQIVTRETCLYGSFIQKGTKGHKNFKNNIFPSMLINLKMNVMHFLSEADNAK